MKKQDTPDFSDLLKLGQSALSALVGAAREFHDHRGDSCDSVTREEFEAAFAMLKKIRAEQDKIESRLARLEKESKPARASKIESKKPKTTRK